MSMPAIIMSLIGIVVLIAAVLGVVFASRIPAPSRVLAALAFVPVALFCVFGFLASFEPGAGHELWRIGYAVILAGCATAGLRLLTVKNVASS